MSFKDFVCGVCVWGGSQTIWANLEEHLHAIILKAKRFRRIFLKILSIFSSGGNFVWHSSTVWAILIEGI